MKEGEGKKWTDHDLPYLQRLKRLNAYQQYEHHFYGGFCFPFFVTKWHRNAMLSYYDLISVSLKTCQIYEHADLWIGNVLLRNNFSSIEFISIVSVKFNATSTISAAL